jgi:hypothetical protein
MTEPGIARLLVASLHQGISDLLPARLDFYEHWLSPDGLRQGTIGLAPALAVLSFLRQEGAAYDRVTALAGRYAAEWTVASLPAARRSLLRAEPLRLRSRSVLRLARRTLGSTCSGHRVTLRVRRGRATFDVRHSVFCGVRDPASAPLCGFFAAVVGRLLELFDVPGEVRVACCRATGADSCQVAVDLFGARPSGALGVVPGR